MARLVLRCPTCGKISLPKLTFRLRQARAEMAEGLVPVLINNYVCGHLFIANVDQNCQARSCIPVEIDGQDSYHLVLVESPIISRKTSFVNTVAETS